MPDELLRPTIGAGVDLSVRPWRLMSQTYVAFFGGVIAATTIAYINSGRIGVDAATRRIVLLIGAVSLVASLAATTAIDRSLGADEPLTPVPGIASTAVALVCSFIQQRFQRPMDRAFQLRGSDYRSLWKAGIAAVIAGSAIHILLSYLVDVAL